jgi:Flp pilus assembly protein TadD
MLLGLEHAGFDCRSIAVEPHRMATQMPAESGSLRAPRMLLVSLTIAAFANATLNGFVWLDHWQVESGGLIVRTWSQLWSALQQPLGAMPGWEGTAPYARPSVVVVLSVVHAIAGDHPAAYHLTLELLHLANVLLAYGVLSALPIDRTVSLLTAALFAVHPLQTAAVSWVSGIADPLFALFTLLALRLQLAASAGTRRAGLARVGALFSFVFALGAKETAAIFPALLALTYLRFPTALPASDGGRARSRGWAILREIAPSCILLIGAALYRLHVLQASAFGRTLGAVPFEDRLRTLPRLLLSYLTLPLRLGSLTVCDDYVLSTRWDASTVRATVALGVLCAGLIWGWRRFRYLTFGTLWMLLALLPALNIVPILHYRADRFFYFPFIGWSLACVALLRGGLAAVARATQMPSRRLHRSAALLAALVLLLLTSLTIRRNAGFIDDLVLFQSTLRVSPFCREAHTTLGDAYLRAGRYSDAIAEYEQARTVQPDRVSYVVMPKVLINLGMAEIGRGNYDAAEAAFMGAHRLQPQLLHPLFGLGIANLGLGRTATAATWLEQAYALAPDDPDVMLNLALSYDRLGRQTEALVLYRRYIDGHPHGRARGLAEQRVQALAALQP